MRSTSIPLPDLRNSASGFSIGKQTAKAKLTAGANRLGKVGQKPTGEIAMQLQSPNRDSSYHFATIYLRTTLEEADAYPYAFETQFSGCADLCELRGWEILDVFTDADVPASANADRPAFEAMLELVRENPSINVVFFDYSRLHRVAAVALAELKRLEQLGAYWVCVCNPEDRHSDGARALRSSTTS
jgi:hypothetical protein